MTKGLGGGLPLRGRDPLKGLQVSFKGVWGDIRQV